MKSPTCSGFLDKCSAHSQKSQQIRQRRRICIFYLPVYNVTAEPFCHAPSFFLVNRSFYLFSSAHLRCCCCSLVCFSFSVLSICLFHFCSMCLFLLPPSISPPHPVPPPPSLCLAVCLSVCLPACLCLCLSVCLCRSLFLSVSVCLSV